MLTCACVVRMVVRMEARCRHCVFLTFLLIFWRQILSVAWNSLSKLSWLARELQESAWLLCGCQRSELRSSCLCDKCFTHWAMVITMTSFLKDSIPSLSWNIFPQTGAFCFSNFARVYPTSYFMQWLADNSWNYTPSSLKINSLLGAYESLRVKDIQL